MKRTNFDVYLDEQMCDPVFAARFESACESWVVNQQDTFAPEHPLIEQTQGCVRSNQDEECEHDLGPGETDVR